MNFCLFVLLLFSFGVHAMPSSIVKGYKDGYYEVSSSLNKVCEYDSRYYQSWCVSTQKSPMGVYLGFKQLIVFSKTNIQAINLVRRESKWTIPLRGIYKLHINYPVIVTFSKDRTLTGYDYFTGYQLWKKSSDYLDLFESGVDLWMVSHSGIEKIDVVSSEVVRKVSFKRRVLDVHGDDLFLYVQLGPDLFHYNLLNKAMHKVGDQFKVIDKASDFLFVGSKKETQIRTFDNQVISDNVKERIFKVHTPTKVLFTYIKGDQLFFVTKNGSVSYQFTRTQNSDKVEYGYKLNDKIRVFNKDGQDVWILKRIKKKESDHDT